MGINNEDFADWMVNRNEESYEYDSKKKEISRSDYRINKPAYSDIDGQYKKFKQVEKSDEYKNTLRAQALLSDRYDTTDDQLTSALKSQKSLTSKECDQVMRNLASNRDVDVHKELFTHKVKLRKK